MSHRLSVLWTKGLEGKAKEDAESVIRNSTLFREQLTKIIDEKLQALENESLDFNENWAFSQAYDVGKKRALKEIRNLINFE